MSKATQRRDSAIEQGRSDARKQKALIEHYGRHAFANKAFHPPKLGRWLYAREYRQGWYSVMHGS